MNILENINSPEDIKNLSAKELRFLAKEIRYFLLENISKTGGHLSANLGVVELTIALHYVFNSPKDKFIWDVGHQSYVHKILTGRQKDFPTLRKLGGLSGFPKTSESCHDMFDVGHSSTSISSGFGYAVSRDILGEDYEVVSIIGDGSISCGLSYEALNNAGRSKNDFIVILNDNQMSIDENVGSMTKHLNDIRTKQTYINAKNDIHNILNKFPTVGNKIGKIIGKTKDSLKYSILEPGIIFEELGFKYIGPIDGHNIDDLIRVFNQTKNIKGPLLLHVYTKKGKGYSFAQNEPDKYHGVSPFNIKTGEFKKEKQETYSDVFGKKILSLGEEHKNLVAITAAMPSGTGLNNFKLKFPERFFDVGIAESHAVTFAAGLAKNKIIPVVALYSTFLQRAYDQILHDVCLQNLHVVFALDRAGLVGDDGETHQGIFDISFLSHIPNMTLLAPKNKFEFEMMLDFAVSFNGPVAIRYPRGNVSKVFSDICEPIELGKSEIISEGSEICIVSAGAMMDEASLVYEKLITDGYNPKLINARFLKPVDINMVSSLKDFKHIFIIEENIKLGGYYSNVLEILNSLDFKGKVFSFSFPDVFVKQGTRQELFIEYGLDAESIYKKIISTL